MIPDFNSFVKSINIADVVANVEIFAPENLRKPSEAFTREQNAIISQTSANVALALMKSYHEWLSEYLA